MNGIGGRPGWAWVFILVRTSFTRFSKLADASYHQEGLFSVVFGVASFFLLPNSPNAIKILSKEEENAISRTLLIDGITEMGKTTENQSWTEFRRTFVQPHVVMLSIVGFFSGEYFWSMSSIVHCLTCFSQVPRYYP